MFEERRLAGMEAEVVNRVQDQLLEWAECPGVREREWLECLKGTRSTMAFGPSDGFALDDRSRGGDGIGVVAFHIAPEEYVQPLNLVWGIVCA